MEDEIAAMKGPPLGVKLVEALLAPEWREIRRTQRQVAQLQAQSSGSFDTAHQVAALNMQVQRLEENLLGLGLYTRTILQCLVEADVLNLEAFAAKMQELDLLDGKQDGK